MNANEKELLILAAQGVKSILTGAKPGGEQFVIRTGIERLLSVPEPDDSEIDRDNEQFNAGVNHTVDLLAKALGVTDYVAGDGSEDYDQDLQQTMMNILIAKGLYDDENGTFARVQQ